MQKKTQVSILLDNKPGELGKVARLMARAKVNIEAMAINDGIHHGVLKMVVDKAEAARKALKKAGIQHSVQTVLSVPLRNEPGALAKLCAKLAGKGVNIDYVYGSGCLCSGECCCDCTIILSSPDAKAVKKILR
jgi:hypothetical protein